MMLLCMEAIVVDEVNAGWLVMGFISHVICVTWSIGTPCVRLNSIAWDTA